MNKGELLALIKTGEGHSLELKEKIPDNLGKHFCAFANASGGKIILGVRDDGSVSGCKLSNSDLSRIHDTARNLDPLLNVFIEKVGNVAVINVPEGKNKPYSSGGHFYYRTGPNSQQMTREEIRNCFQHEGLIHFDESPNTKFDFSRDFNNNKFKEYISKAGISTVHKDTDILRNLNLMEGSKLKNAGVLFFSRDITKFFMSAIVSCVLFEGTSNTIILDKKEFDADIMSNYENAIMYIFSKLNTNYIIGRERIERLELPEDALREAIINAIVHRDYYSNGHIQINIFIDRVEITNPGGLVSGLKRRELGKKSVPRNSLLMGLFLRIDQVEKAGTGIKRIREAMKKYGLKVRFDVNERWFDVIFSRKMQIVSEEDIQEKVGVKSQKTPRKRPENAQKLLDAITNNPFITRQELVKITNLSEYSIKYIIGKLKKAKAVQRIGGDKGGHWKVLK